MGKCTVDWGALNQFFAENPEATCRQAAAIFGCSAWAANQAKQKRGFVSAEVGQYDPQLMVPELIAHCRAVRRLVGHLLYGLKRPEVQLDLLEELDETLC